MKRTTSFLLAIAVLLISFIVINCRNNKTVETDTNHSITDSLKILQPEHSQDSISIISDFENYQSIEDVINYREFKDKVLYIDIWSLYCGPCIKEFQESKDLKQRYHDKPVIFIYLVDMLNTRENSNRWDSLVNKYKLYGFHLQMSEKFYNNINLIKGIKFIGKPHYILVDKKGNIVNPNADRPSSKEKLYNQIDALL